jgi:hypothetical protein
MVLALAFVLGGCGESSDQPKDADLPTRFAAYDPAPEPNADISKVVWPDFVTAAGPEVKALYVFQLRNGGLMRFMPCFCGCGGEDGHRSARDCFVQRVEPDGRAVLDAMAPTCEICKDVTREAMRLQTQGKTPREIRTAIDTRYSDLIEQATPTPYPPA